MVSVLEVTLGPWPLPVYFVLPRQHEVIHHMLLPQESMLPQTKATGLSDQGLKIETTSQSEPALLWIVLGLISK